MAIDKEWVVGEIGRWLTNDERLYRVCVYIAKSSLSRRDLATQLKRFSGKVYRSGDRFGEVALTEVRSLRLIDWDEIAGLFEDDAPWKKGEQP